MRETFSPPRSSTLQRRESMLSKGFNAIFRRDSMMHKSNNNNNNNNNAAATKGGLNLRTATAQQTNSNMINNNNNNSSSSNLQQKRLSRAMSFKHPERISHIPPPEVTRLRSKSQVSVNEYSTASSGGSSGIGSGSGGPGYVDLPYAGGGETSDHTIYSSQSPLAVKPWQAREKYMIQRNHSFMPPKNIAGRGGPMMQSRPLIVKREMAAERSNNGFGGPPPPRGRQRHPLPPEFFFQSCLLYTSPSPRDLSTSRMPSSA